MAAAAPDTFGKTGCGQIEAEVHHDGLPMENNPLFDKTLDALQNNCWNFAKENHPRFSDKSFLQHIFNTPGNIGQAKEYLYNRGLPIPQQQFPAQQNPPPPLLPILPGQQNPQAPLPPNKIFYKGQFRNPNQGSSYLITANNYIGSIYSFPNPINNPPVMRALINRIIAHCAVPPSSGAQELYLFIDTARNLIDAMNDAMGPNDPFLNVINSQISLADSATAGKDLYKTPFFRNHVKCWWFQKNIVIPPYGIIVPPRTFPLNLIFHTSLTCELSDAGPQEWSNKKIAQRWRDSTFTPNPINDASEENKITSIIASFKASKTKEEKSWCYQRKRSGDGFQIWFIYYFSYFLCKTTNGFGSFFCTCKDGQAQYYPTTQDWLPPSPTNDTNDIRARSFFVTIDWPALCWAAYCHMNVIFYLPDGNVILFIADNRGYSVLPVA
jgi:hypothetical protein